jgi:RNA polymerase sigma factor (sigma-70 family)
MPGAQLDTLVQHLRRAAGPQVAGGPSDAVLLERFVRDRDETAFELLIWRHGAMVYNVCRRVLRSIHDAEDAFQATFLTLVRKAGAIGKRESVGGWLCKVAYRIALRAKATQATQPLARDPQPDSSTEEPIVGLLWREWREALDAEVARLPDKYRAAFVLCYLEGQTTTAAAQTLGCAPGTVGTRLARARQRLRHRLLRRGFDASALAAPRAVLAVPPAALVASTVQTLVRTANGAETAGLIPAHVAALTKGALRSMFLTRFSSTAAAAALALGLLSGGAFLALRTPTGVAAEPSSAGAGEGENGGVLLRWKFAKDRPFYQELTTETDQDMKVNGNTVRQNQAQTYYYRWTPRGRDEDGNWILVQRITGIRMNIDIGGSKVEFDSTKEARHHNPLAAFLRGLVGSELQVTLTRGGKVQKVEGRDAIIKKLSAANPNLGTVLEQVLSEAAIRHAAQECFAALPEGAVRPGATWTRKTQEDMSPVGSYRATGRYTYEGRQGNVDQIKIETGLKDWRPAGNGADLAFSFKTTDFKGTGSGFLLFERDKGRVVRMESSLIITSKVTFGIGEQETELTQTQKTTLRTTDADPLAPAESLEDLKKEIEHLRQENIRLRKQLEAVRQALQREGKPSD